MNNESRKAIKEDDQSVIRQRLDELSDAITDADQKSTELGLRLIYVSVGDSPPEDASVGKDRLESEAATIVGDATDRVLRISASIDDILSRLQI